jgi:hypothetical protein
MPVRRIIETWWPLAASWLLMSAEVPALSAVVARLPQPVINLAAYGGVVYPLALIIESPIIMLLAASTALSKDWASYLKIRRFMMLTSALLTVVHLLVVLTPLYYVVVKVLIAAPPEIIEPARIGLLIMTPWTWSIAYRRFNQGVLIRFGHSRAVGTGTVVRLSAETLVLVAGYMHGHISGIVVATSAAIAGVCCEALYVGARVRPVLAEEVRLAPQVSPALTFHAFRHFYTPLVLTSLLSLLAQPIGSSAISRMPDPLPSLAVWPVVTGLIFLLRSLGVALNEVVVALLDEAGSVGNLRRFALWLAAVSTLILLTIAATPLATFWFSRVAALPPDLALLAQRGLWFGLLIPALAVFQSWYQGALLHGRRTSGISEAVVVYLIASVVVFGAGIVYGQVAGLYIGLLALLASNLAQTIWLGYRGRPALQATEHPLRESRHPA